MSVVLAHCSRIVPHKLLHDRRADAGILHETGGRVPQAVEEQPAEIRQSLTAGSIILGGRASTIPTLAMVVQETAWAAKRPYRLFRPASGRAARTGRSPSVPEREYLV